MDLPEEEKDLEPAYDYQTAEEFKADVTVYAAFFKYIWSKEIIRGSASSR